MTAFACRTCGRITAARYCADHKPLDTRPPAHERGYGPRWRQFRTRFLVSHPYCRECGAEATDVHHLDGLGPDGPAGYDPRNCEALCHSCHSQQTAAQQPAGWNA